MFTTYTQPKLDELIINEFETVVPGDEDDVEDLLARLTKRIVVIHHTMVEFFLDLLATSSQLLNRNFELRVLSEDGRVGALT